MKSERCKVLVVDDNPADRLIYRMALSGFEISDADGGQAALESCRAQLPDCILLDFNMPVINGLQFIEALKAQHGDLPCAVVMLTGVRDESIAVQAMKSGTLDYLPKSQNVGEILALAVNGAVDKYRMRRQVKQQQLALEASEHQYRTLMEALPQLVWLANSAGKIQYANRPWRDYTGFAWPGDYSQQDVILIDDRERFLSVWREATGASQSIEVELRIQKPLAGTACWHLVRLTPIHDEAGESRWLGTATNIEAVKQAEIAIQTKQRSESIGLLAGGIAHDFNNLLVGILGGASLLADSIPPTEEAQSTLAAIVQSAERAAQLTSQLLAYSGKGQFFVEPIDLSALVRKACDLIRPSIPSKVELSIETVDHTPIIESDRSQMQQVITNLVMNAVEAIPKDQSGRVSVRTVIADFSPDSLPGDQVPPDHLPAGSYAVLEVQDTGSGMNVETKAKIFDPFFTTKFVGRGLGLAAVQGILRGVKGQIIVDSELGRGSTFKVLLPIHRMRGTANRAGPSMETGVERNSGGAILVIDDEPAVRQLLSRALGRAGYEVFAAEDGPTGLARLEQQRESISLVLLDMGMPQMGGEEVLRKMRAAGHRVPVAICSGYSESEVLARFAGSDFSAFIQKPFKTDELTRRIRSLLAGPAGHQGSGQNRIEA